jgi:hypothetical protein
VYCLAVSKEVLGGLRRTGALWDRLSGQNMSIFNKKCKLTARTNRKATGMKRKMRGEKEREET